MQTIQGTRLESLRAVQAFLIEHADRLPDVADSGARRKFDGILAELSRHVADQSGSALAAQGATRKLHALRRALIRDHMLPISTIASAEFTVAPEVEPFRVPRGNPAVHKLAAAAHGMAKAAAPHAALFISSGRRSDFIARLTDAADAVVESANDRSQRSGKRIGATKGLKTKLASARRMVRVLDAFISSAAHDDPVLLANWRTVRRVRRVAARSTNHAQSSVADVSEVAVTQLRVLPEPSSSAVHERITAPVEYAQLNP